MDPNTDITRRKPRQTKGTPSFHYRNRFAAGIILAGIATFAAFAYTPIFRVANEKLVKELCTETEEERDRKQLFNMNAAPRRGEEILKMIEEKKELESKQ
ncbi:uncharacterized protein LOC129947070 [Eupeodes corollae]|uniref:uncharacterized protein LOC129947070 n=1 Tax=Eupeodes corollae TaxID=290404 RepID=UPI0024933C28|nr:uncharacterized protein LOC129947070 [Eupeodes corollae]